MIIVTGAAGFIGSQLAKNLSKRKQQLLLVDRISAFEDRNYHQSLPQPFRLMEAEGTFLRELPGLNDVKLIVHMGAITNTAERDLDQLKKWNVDYTKAIWNFCAEKKVPLIYASSAAT